MSKLKAVSSQVRLHFTPCFNLACYLLDKASLNTVSHQYPTYSANNRMHRLGKVDRAAIGAEGLALLTPYKENVSIMGKMCNILSLQFKCLKADFNSVRNYAILCFLSRKIKHTSNPSCHPFSETVGSDANDDYVLQPSSHWTLFASTSTEVPGNDLGKPTTTSVLRANRVSHDLMSGCALLLQWIDCSFK